MLIEAGGLNKHANVTQSPAVLLWNLHFFRFSSFPVYMVSFILLPLHPFGQGSLPTGRIRKIDTQHFLQVRFYPAEKDQVMGDQVMQL